MKRILTLAMVLALSGSMTFAATNFGASVKNAVKQDIKNTRTDIKKSVQQDIDNKKQEQTAASTAKKQEKIKQIDAKLKELNKEMATVKNDKKITETERTLKTRSIQRQIDFYTKQKAALK